MIINSLKQARRLYIVRLISRSPARVSILGFAALIAIGTALLMLPAASTSESLGFIDALFTATSAGCVTGLAVVDTGKSFSLFGQIVIMILIQTGGIGIMTLSTLFLMMAGRRLSLSGKMGIKDTFTNSGDVSINSVIKEVFLFTLIIEGIGLVIMNFLFLRDYGGVDAFYYALFHSVSAFCNAGFSLFSDSFLHYKGDWLLNLVLCFLIIFGGIGFVVISELKRHFTEKSQTGNPGWARLSFHSKLAISTTAILLAASTILILITEWNYTLSSLPFFDRFLASFFQAVNTRTAGFNSLPLESMASETLFLIIILMFIGACPGSCGGGIKTTTFASLSVLGISRLMGRKRPKIFNRTIPEASIGKAMSLVMTGMFIVVAATMALLMSELSGLAQASTRGKFLELFFEVTSAFGTAGLSTGITSSLSSTGKLIISMIMFIGRLGPLVIAIAISREKISRVYHAEENIMIG
ncbi:TrkH family potassium uptake protein [Desulfobacterales bacterium HSG16]|nr:TrkH family potassium uptake protein [Desulfobacterales bacterium HSG16]